MFHRHFPYKKISTYYLRKAYREAGIKKKKIRKTKLITAAKKLRQHDQIIEAHDKLV